MDDQGAGTGSGRRARHELMREIIDEGAVTSGRQDRCALGERLGASGHEGLVREAPRRAGQAAFEALRMDGMVTGRER